MFFLQYFYIHYTCNYPQNKLKPLTNIAFDIFFCFFFEARQLYCYCIPLQQRHQKPFSILNKKCHRISIHRGTSFIIRAEPLIFCGAFLFRTLIARPSPNPTINDLTAIQRERGSINVFKKGNICKLRQLFQQQMLSSVSLFSQCNTLAPSVNGRNCAINNQKRICL